MHQTEAPNQNLGYTTTSPKPAMRSSSRGVVVPSPVDPRGPSASRRVHISTYLVYRKGRISLSCPVHSEAQVGFVGSGTSAPTNARYWE